MLALVIGILKAPVTALVAWLVTCFDIIKFEFAKLTVDTSLLPTWANKPPLSDTIGDPTRTFVWTAAEGNDPTHTPLTDWTASTFAVVRPTFQHG